MGSSAQPPGEIAIAGIPFRIASLEQATAWILESLEERSRPGRAIRLANAYCVALASVEPHYAELLSTRGVNFPDGTPVVALMRALGASASDARRVRGPSLFREVLRAGASHDIRHFFLGSTPATLQALTKAVEVSVPGIQIAGTYSPPFETVDEDYLNNLVERAKHWDADVVWVGMGTPKQDFIADALASRTGVTAIGIGAGFDFVAGTVKEAPGWARRSGLEWAYRFSKEPRRLWQRYLFGNARFLNLALTQLSHSGRRRQLLSRATIQRNSSTKGDPD